MQKSNLSLFAKTKKTLKVLSKAQKHAFKGGDDNGGQTGYTPPPPNGRGPR